MSKKKKLLKKLRRLGKARGVGPGSSSEGRPTMPSDTAQSEEHRDPRDGTAAIPPVTDAMMDHAAHEAAALADGVAHHTIALDAQAAGTPDLGTDAAPSPAAEPVADVAERAVDAATDAARHAVAAAATAVSEAQDAAVQFSREAADGAERAAEAAQEASSASADALTRYNAKLFEMMRANAASTTALFAALVQAKSIPEALSLNADHLRRQMETLTSQGRELATLAQGVALDALQPFKGQPPR